MSADRYDFDEDDWFDGAAMMTIRGRKERLEKMLALPSHSQTDDK